VGGVRDCAAGEQRSDSVMVYFVVDDKLTYFVSQGDNSGLFFNCYNSQRIEKQD